MWKTEPVLTDIKCIADNNFSKLYNRLENQNTKKYLFLDYSMIFSTLCRWIFEQQT